LPNTTPVEYFLARLEGREQETQAEACGHLKR
jgi:hypothetical protein